MKKKKTIPYELATLSLYEIEQKRIAYVRDVVHKNSHNSEKLSLLIAHPDTLIARAACGAFSRRLTIMGSNISSDEWNYVLAVSDRTSDINSVEVRLIDNFFTADHDSEKLSAFLKLVLAHSRRDYYLNNKFQQLLFDESEKNEVLLNEWLKVSTNLLESSDVNSPQRLEALEDWITTYHDPQKRKGHEEAYRKIQEFKERIRTREEALRKFGDR